ncbi:MAG: SMP-30/gluconolactonase/LRE family protein [Alphaproteobacteria bacterium]|nr:SMP-30/gluconolactonase/LRE family protein [Alphaproteobacteria bacterium]
MSLFPPPARLETTVFASVPDRFRTKRRTVWGDINKGGEAVDSFLEGPSFDRGGNLWVVDIAHGRIFRIAPDGKEWALMAEYDGEPNGLKITKDGRIVIADYKNGIMQLDPATGTVTPLIDRRRLERFKGVNDLFFAGNGDMYFTDQGQTGLQDPTGRVYRWRNGQLDMLIGTVPSPNGLVTNLAETILYVAVTRDNSVWRLPLMPDGGVSKVGVFVRLSGGTAGPDGMALDAAGNLFVAHCGMGCVWAFSPLGEPLYRIVSCTGIMTTNVAFGGPENRSLFITESDTGTILRAELPTPGRKMQSHA